MTPHQPPHAVLKPDRVKVEQKSYLTAAHPQVRQKLCFMCRR
jgi:hypothetical protein